MIRIVMLAIAMLAAASLQASSQPSGSRAIVGWGLKSCGTWTQVRQATESADHTVIEAWVVGFMSGMNLDRTHPDALVGTDFDGLMAWIDNYCRSNPLQAIAFAATSLMEELRSRAGRR
jgi:hypothetical protein